jgi:hypothetical protein
MESFAVFDFYLKQSKRKVAYFTISRFFQRKFLPLHFLHFIAVAALREPQSLQIFMYKRCCCAMDFLTGSNIGMLLYTFCFG